MTRFSADSLATDSLAVLVAAVLIAGVLSILALCLGPDDRLPPRY